MALLSESARRKLWQKFMEAGNSPGAVTKDDIKAAIDAVDQWFENNLVALNQALPQPFRGQASDQQKAILLSYIALERAGVI